MPTSNCHRMTCRVRPSPRPVADRVLLALAVFVVSPSLCSADSSADSGEESSCAGQSSCLSAGSIIPLTFLVIFVLIMLLWCALHICCNFPCCWSCARGGQCRTPRCSSFFRCFSNTTAQSQVYTHLHADDVPLSHPVLSSPSVHLAPLVAPPRTAPHYRPYKGSYRIGKNHHLQPFTLNLRFDYTTSPRTLAGHGVDDGQSFTLHDAAFTVSSSGEHRCVFVERFGDGSRYVFYGVWDGWQAEERWSGVWLRESGAQQQGSFTFQFDEAADEQMRAAREQGETDMDGWMERRMREQLAARERRYIVLRGLEERKEATDGPAAAQRGEREPEEGLSAIELMERRLSRPLTATAEIEGLDDVAVDVAAPNDDRAEQQVG